MKKISTILLCICCLCTVATEGQAVVLSKLTLVERSPFIVGSLTSIDVVIEETRDVGETSKIGTLFTISGNIRFTGSGSNTFQVSNLVDHGIQSGRFFDNGGGTATITQSGFSGTVEQADLTPSATEDPLGTIASNTYTSLRLASFTLSGGAVGESITFTMQDFDVLLDDIVLDDGTVLDSNIQFGSLTITGTSGGNAVPEPGSIILFGSFIGSLALRINLRSKRASLGF